MKTYFTLLTFVFFLTSSLVTAKEIINGTGSSAIDEIKTIDVRTVMFPDGTTTPGSDTEPPITSNDCLASYSPVTGEVIIPCLKIDGSDIVYRVKQHQIPLTMTFEVRGDDVTRVQ